MGGGKKHMILSRRFPSVRSDRPGHGWSSHFDAGGFSQTVFAKKPSPSGIVFRILLIWLDSLD